MSFLYLLETIRNPMFDKLFQFCTYLGQDIFIIGIICILFWCYDKKLAYQLGFTFFLSGLLLQNLKITFHIPRPWIIDSNFKPVASAVPAATGYSFPSGHTQSATALFTALAFSNRNRGQKYILFFLPLLVAFSRMYLGVHTPKDVCIAFLITIVISYLVFKFIPCLNDSKMQDLMIAIVFATLSVLTLIYTSMLVKNGTIEINQAKDCYVSGGAGLGFAVSFYIERNYINFSPKANMRNQIIKVIIGLAVTGIVKVLMKAILGGTMPAEVIQYFFLVIWALVLYPFIIKRIF